MDTPVGSDFSPPRSIYQGAESRKRAVRSITSDTVRAREKKKRTQFPEKVEIRTGKKHDPEVADFSKPVFFGLAGDVLFYAGCLGVIPR
ncbi:MAG: hypothetical protein LIQ31_00095 [Planctomycetes bacterium]|nr:hypothetical protein [Planctomycetota bacterium]